MNQESAAQAPDQSNRKSSTMMVNFFAGITAIFLLIFLISFAFILGAWIAGTGLHDPDTCWLLALGRLIFDKHQLPTIDPFSYTFASQHLPFVMYQWLAELLFFLPYKYNGLAGLLTSVALLISISFLALPLVLSHRLQAPLPHALGLSILAAIASSFHFLVRPEVFSYFLLFLWLYWFQNWRSIVLGECCYEEPMVGSDYLFRKQSTNLVVLCAVTMALWANLHTGFIVGLVWLGIFFIFEAAERLYRGVISQGHFRYVPISLGVAILATLCNPYGIGLWHYLPSLFFADFNRYIDEVKPLGFANLAEFTFYPYVVLGLLAMTVNVVCWHKVQSVREKIRKQQRYGRWFSVVIVGISFVSGFFVRRLIPFASIIMLCECIFLLAREHSIAKALYQNSNPDEDKPTASEVKQRLAHRDSFLTLVHRRFLDLFTPSWRNCFLTTVLLSFFGCYVVVTRIEHPTLPQSSKAFGPPHHAIKYLASHPITGRIFNDAQYGDMLIWYMPEHPPVFIDTRFDMYGSRLVTDYRHIRYCEENFEKLWNRYAFDSAFLPVQSKLVNYLIHEGWVADYKDQQAIVMHKP